MFSCEDKNNNKKKKRKGFEGSVSLSLPPSLPLQGGAMKGHKQEEALTKIPALLAP